MICILVEKTHFNLFNISITFLIEGHCSPRSFTSIIFTSRLCTSFQFPSSILINQLRMASTASSEPVNSQAAFLDTYKLLGPLDTSLLGYDKRKSSLTSRLCYDLI